MLLGCIYRSPNSTTANSDQLTTLLNKLHKEKYSHLLELLDFSLTVKPATLIFLSGCGFAISSAKEGKSVFIYLVKSL